MGTRLFFLRLNIDLFSLPLQDIDGQALLLLTLPTVQECMDLKLGPAIKLCHQIERVKVAFYRQYANWSRSSASPTEHPGREAWEMLDVGLGASWWKILEVLAMESVQRDLFFLFSFFGFVLESCFGKTQKKNEDLWINFWDAVGVKMWCNTHKKRKEKEKNFPRCRLRQNKTHRSRSECFTELWRSYSERLRTRFWRCLCVYFLLFTSILFVIEEHYSS